MSHLPVPARAALVAMVALLGFVAIDLSGDDDLTGYLRVGEFSSARAFVEADIPDTHIVPGWGHDGQANYVLARALPDLHDAQGHLDSVTYRARRIVYPALASVLPPGHATVAGLLALNVMATGIAAAGLTPIVRRLGGHWLVAATVALTPAFIASTIISLGDGLGLALAAAGVALWRRPRATAWAVTLFALAALTRETTLVIPAAVFLWEGRGRRRWLLLPPAALVAWMGVLQTWIGDAGKSAAQFTAPFAGWLDQGIATEEIVVAMVLLVASLWVASELWPLDRTWSTIVLFDAAVLVLVDRAVLFNLLNLARVVPWVVPFGILLATRRRTVDEPASRPRSADEDRLGGEGDAMVDGLVHRAPSRNV
ncbi:MAG: hypothetical protein AAF548_20585 [Actinomycetota bacterium]